ncbi:unnamed protein product [Amoebophrya sp. A25]|nr:unnamed protein product [Amoebophrya sp. A25]|eukprot:GSA25T00015530001.1
MRRIAKMAHHADRFVLYNPPRDLRWDWPCGHFSAFLTQAVLHFDKVVDKKFVFHESEDFFTLYDGFPKAKVHLLAVPRRRLDSLKDVAFLGGDHDKRQDQAGKGQQGAEGEQQAVKQDVETFQPTRTSKSDTRRTTGIRQHTDDVGTSSSSPNSSFLEDYLAYVNRILRIVRRLFPKASFRYGLHADPSLTQLHCHIISEDFRSDCLKNKKHWLSFQPPFLVPLEHVVKVWSCLESTGCEAISDCERSQVLVQFLKGRAEAGMAVTELRCCCGAFVAPNMPKLKQHLETCIAQRPPWPPPFKGVDMKDVDAGSGGGETITTSKRTSPPGGSTEEPAMKKMRSE